MYCENGCSLKIYHFKILNYCHVLLKFVRIGNILKDRICLKMVLKIFHF